MLTSFSAERLNANVLEGIRTEHFLIEKYSYCGVRLIKQYIFKPKCNCRGKSMQEEESVMVVRCMQIENSSFGITVRHHSASLVMPIPKCLCGKKLLKNVTLQILNFVSRVS